MVMRMELIQVNLDNLEQEHICCALADKKGECQVSSKKAWLQKRFEEGLIFLKGKVRGKVFIEYIPAENAWCGVEAAGYMFINCLWVSGQFKGQGISTQLLDACIRDSKDKGKKGLVILSSAKKKPYLADEKFLKYKGFKVADQMEPYFDLMYLPFEMGALVPTFKDDLKRGAVQDPGFVLYYSAQCPFTARYVPMIAAIAKQKGLAFKAIKVETTKQAQSIPTPFTTYSLFYNGKFLTHEILSDKKFMKLLEGMKS